MESKVNEGKESTGGRNGFEGQQKEVVRLVCYSLGGVTGLLDTVLEGIIGGGYLIDIRKAV